MTIPQPSPSRLRGAADVVFVLCLLQAAFLLLGGAGEMLLMGANPAYFVLPLGKAALLVVLAIKVVSGRRWAMIMLTVLQAITLYGFWLQLVIGVLPVLNATVNLVGLLTNVGIPAAIAYLCARSLPDRRLRPDRRPRAATIR